MPIENISTTVRVAALSSLMNPAGNPHRNHVTKAGILFTLVALVLVSIEQGPILVEQFHQHRWQELAVHGIFLLIAALLVYGGLVYLFTRLGYIHRLRQHTPASREDLNTFAV